MTDVLPLMIGTAAVAHCFFLIAVLLKLSGKLANRLLTVILLLLAFRMGACITGLLYPTLETATTFLGAISLAMIGPLMIGYLHSLWYPSFRLNRAHVYHMIPTLLILLSLPFFDQYVAFGSYVFALLTLTIYLTLTINRIKQWSVSIRSDEMRWKWTLNFLWGISTIWVLLMIQLFFFDELIYQGIIIISAFVVYGLTIWSVQRVRLFMSEPRQPNKRQQLETLGKQIEKLLKKEEVYTNAMLTVAVLADELKSPPYLVSQAINAYFDKTFPEIINALRIQKAEQLLTDASKSHYTVEAIAYESGFSTLSAFYATFKKANHKTPAQFRANERTSSP